MSPWFGFRNEGGFLCFYKMKVFCEKFSDLIFERSIFKLISRFQVQNDIFKALKV